jgi:hypothetical protein
LNIFVARTLFEENQDFAVRALFGIAGLDPAGAVSEGGAASGATHLNGIVHEMLSVRGHGRPAQTSRLTQCGADGAVGRRGIKFNFSRAMATWHDIATAYLAGFFFHEPTAFGALYFDQIRHQLPQRPIDSYLKRIKILRGLWRCAHRAETGFGDLNGLSLDFRCFFRRETLIQLNAADQMPN